MKILHISDLHVYNDNVSFLKLLFKYGLDKRISGYLNFYLRRKQVFTKSLRQAMLRKLVALDWDYLIITGDITVLGIEEEFHLAKAQLMPLLEKAPCYIIPGNHDRYTPSTLYPDYMKYYFGDFLLVNEVQEGALVELNEHIALLGLHMAKPRPWFRADGELPQFTQQYFEQLKNHRAQYKMLAGHYPAFLPHNITENASHAVKNKSILEQGLLNANVNLYLHGHIHKSFSFQKNDTLTCVNSAGGFCKTTAEFGGVHLITIQDDFSTSLEKILPSI